MTRHKHKKPLIKLRSFYIWHRYMGLTVMLFALLLSVTGLVLNHTDSLELDRRAIDSAWLLDWYEIEPPQNLTSYRAGNKVVSLVEDRLYIERQAIPGHYESLAGSIGLQDMIVIAVDSQILLLTREGEIIERLTDIDNRVQKLAAVGFRETGELVVRTNDATYLTDSNLSQWQVIQPGDRHIKWAAPIEITAGLGREIRHHYRASILTLERVLLDLHSGRILGSAGVLVMDAVAIIFILLAASGFWIWVQQHRKRALHRHKTH